MNYTNADRLVDLVIILLALSPVFIYVGLGLIWRRK